MKTVKSVWLSATARKSSAFSSVRIRKDIRLLPATAILGMTVTPLELCTHLKSTSQTNGSQLLWVFTDYMVREKRVLHLGPLRVQVIIKLTNFIRMDTMCYGKAETAL